MSEHGEYPRTNMSVEGGGVRQSPLNKRGLGPNAEFLAEVSDKVEKAYTIGRAMTVCFGAQFLDPDSWSEASPTVRENLEQMDIMMEMALDHIDAARNLISGSFAAFAAKDTISPRAPMAEHVALKRAELFDAAVAAMQQAINEFNSLDVSAKTQVPASESLDATVGEVIHLPVETAAHAQLKLQAFLDWRFCGEERDIGDIKAIIADLGRLAAREGC